MLPTLRQLQYLKLLAEHETFSKAAEVAHISQPALSAGMQELEKILGASLVERGRGKVLLTRAGQAALERAGAILAAAEDLVEVVRAAGKPLSGRFRLGAIPTVAPFLFPRVLPKLRDRFSDLKLYLREDQTARLIASLKSGALDAALIALPYDVAGLDYVNVATDEIVAAMPAGHPIAAYAVAPLDMVQDSDLILLEDGHCLRDHALLACRIPEKGPDSFAASSLATLVQMVESGLGVTLLPSLAVEAGLANSARLAVRRLDTEHAEREIVLAWRAGFSRAPEARLLAEVMREA